MTSFQHVCPTASIPIEWIGQKKSRSFLRFALKWQPNQKIAQPRGGFSVESRKLPQGERSQVPSMFDQEKGWDRSHILSGLLGLLLSNPPDIVGCPLFMGSFRLQVPKHVSGFQTLTPPAGNLENWGAIHAQHGEVMSVVLYKLGHLLLEHAWRSRCEQCP